MNSIVTSAGQIAASEFAGHVDSKGWATTGPIIERAHIVQLREEVASIQHEERGGARNLFNSSAIRDLAKSPEVRSLAESVLGRDCFAVRAILFDKTRTANWKVIWHQDVTIATRERVEIPGFNSWSVKAGVPHVQPPTEYLETMLAVRVHLDPCGAENGAVRVISGSHTRGRLSDAETMELCQHAVQTTCIVDEGGILAFKPLLLHASSAAVVPGHRRVIHIEFASVDLPAPLEWHSRVA